MIWKWLHFIVHHGKLVVSKRLLAQASSIGAAPHETTDQWNLYSTFSFNRRYESLRNSSQFSRPSHQLMPSHILPLPMMAKFEWLPASGNKHSVLSLMGEEGLRKVNPKPSPLSPPSRRCSSSCFFTRPRRFSYFWVSILAARRRVDLPGLASGLIIHHELLPVPSFCTRIKRLCSDRLCRTEFCNHQKPDSLHIAL